MILWIKSSAATRTNDFSDGHNYHNWSFKYPRMFVAKKMHSTVWCVVVRRNHWTIFLWKRGRDNIPVFNASVERYRSWRTMDSAGLWHLLGCAWNGFANYFPGRVISRFGYHDLAILTSMNLLLWSHRFTPTNPWRPKHWRAKLSAHEILLHLCKIVNENFARHVRVCHQTVSSIYWMCRSLINFWISSI